MPSTPFALVRYVLYGVLMGGADVIPGVSGGTMALIVGIYERLVRALSAAVSWGLAVLRLDLDAARTYYEKTLDLESNYPDAWYGLGCCFDAEEKHEEALECFRYAVNLKSNVHKFWTARADCAYKAGKLDEALEAYQHAVRLDESNEHAWTGYAEALLEKQKPEEALEAYRQALELDPERASTYFRQAKALLALGRADESIRALKTAFRLDPTKKDDFRQAYPSLYNNDRVRQLLDLDS